MFTQQKFEKSSSLLYFKIQSHFFPSREYICMRGKSQAQIYFCVLSVAFPPNFWSSKSKSTLTSLVFIAAGGGVDSGE